MNSHEEIFYFSKNMSMPVMFSVDQMQLGSVGLPRDWPWKGHRPGTTQNEAHKTTVGPGTALVDQDIDNRVSLIIPTTQLSPSLRKRDSVMMRARSTMLMDRASPYIPRPSSPEVLLVYRQPGASHRNMGATDKQCSSAMGMNMSTCSPHNFIGSAIGPSPNSTLGRKSFPIR